MTFELQEDICRKQRLELQADWLGLEIDFRLLKTWVDEITQNMGKKTAKIKP